MAPSEYDDNDSEPQSLEDDPRLLELAKQSALCTHEVLGVRYDESRGVDIGDVKFVVVVLSLPLGSKYERKDECVLIDSVAAADSNLCY